MAEKENKKKKKEIITYRGSEKEQQSLKWTSDKTNLFCKIPADPMNNFIEIIEKKTLKNHLLVKYLIPLLWNLRNSWKILCSKKNI